jgi:hypothetical protein
MAAFGQGDASRLSAGSLPGAPIPCENCVCAEVTLCPSEIPKVGFDSHPCSSTKVYDWSSLLDACQTGPVGAVDVLSLPAFEGIAL